MLLSWRSLFPLVVLQKESRRAVHKRRSTQLRGLAPDPNGLLSAYGLSWNNAERKKKTGSLHFALYLQRLTVSPNYAIPLILHGGGTQFWRHEHAVFSAGWGLKPSNSVFAFSYLAPVGRGSQDFDSNNQGLAKWNMVSQVRSYLLSISPFAQKSENFEMVPSRLSQLDIKFFWESW